MKTLKIALIALGLGMYFFAFQGARPLWEPDEGRYSVVAMMMLRSGNWIEPHVDHEVPLWSKPPLTYWAIAASVGTFGRHELAVRLPGALAFLLTTGLLWVLGGVFVPEKRWLPAVVYASFLTPFVASNVVTSDGLLTLWETAAVCAFAWAVWGREQAAGWRMLLMWLAFGLAFLTKGPPGLLPLIAIAAFVHWPGSAVPRPRLRWLAGLGVLLAVNLPWYGLVVARNPGLGGYLLVDEVWKRVMTGAHHRNSQWYGAVKAFGPVFLLGTLPWGLPLARGVAGALRHLRTAGAGLEARWQRVRAQDLFLLLWIAGPLLVFSLARSRLPLYVLPLFAPMALLAARGLARRTRRWRRWWLAVVAWCLLLMAARFGVAHFVVNPKDNAARVARAIRALDPPPSTEIAFYATTPMLGLDFYLGLEVERVGEEMLAEELAEAEQRLWMVRSERTEELISACKALGRTVTPLGDVGGRYRLLFERAPGPVSSPSS